MEVYGDLLSEFASLDISNKAFWSSKSILIFRVHLELFTEFVSCGSCMYFNTTVIIFSVTRQV